MHNTYRVHVHGWARHGGRGRCSVTSSACIAATRSRWSASATKSLQLRTPARMVCLTVGSVTNQQSGMTASSDAEGTWRAMLDNTTGGGGSTCQSGPQCSRAFVYDEDESRAGVRGRTPARLFAS